MTAGAGTEQSTRKHRPGRIIERPRLIKQLDAAEAPVILIVGPAGYGKTTLARQWARTLNGVIWVSCTPSHRDVVTFAEDVAEGIDALGGNASRFVGEYMRARSNPQRAAREIAQVLAEKLNESPARWLIIDDYQELVESIAPEEMVAVLSNRCRPRMLILSRSRPSWMAARHLVYGEVAEIGTADLALTDSEVAELIGSRPELEPVVRQAQGWPAVVALASRLTGVSRREPVAATLHQYVADELFQGADQLLQRRLLELALLPGLTQQHLEAQFGTAAPGVVAAARGVGFIGPGEPLELHPLLREFLLAKLAAANDLDPVREAINRALDVQAWTLALELVVRFRLTELTDPVLQRAFKPLVRSGRLETLDDFARAVGAPDGFMTAALDVVHAEVAVREGHFELAAGIAERARGRLPSNHELKSRASLIVGRAHFLAATFGHSARAYEEARSEALDDIDKLESAFGLAATTIFSEDGDPWPALAELEHLKHATPVSLLRYATVRLNVGRFAGTSATAPSEEAVAALPLAADPHARTAFTYTSAYLLCVRSEYHRAAEFLAMFEKDVREFDLDFGKPFLDWTHAFVDLGLRRFGDADRRLQRVEDAAANDHHRIHGFNARVLRARLLLQTGEHEAAIELLREPAEAPVYPSWRGELLATRALALACEGRIASSRDAADEATDTTSFVEVALLAQAARGVAAASDPDGDGSPICQLFADAARTEAWDPVVCALRSSRVFAERVAKDGALRPIVQRLLQKAEDPVLARHLGLTARSTRAPDALLSPREIEVMGLMARGMRNKEIAAALFVAESTIKVHVRHILEKLGVRSRSAAVARFERVARD